MATWAGSQIPEVTKLENLVINKNETQKFE